MIFVRTKPSRRIPKSRAPPRLFAETVDDKTRSFVRVRGLRRGFSIFRRPTRPGVDGCLRTRTGRGGRAFRQGGAGRGNRRGREPRPRSPCAAFRARAAFGQMRSDDDDGRHHGTPRTRRRQRAEIRHCADAVVRGLRCVVEFSRSLDSIDSFRVASGARRSLQ